MIFGNKHYPPDTKRWIRITLATTYIPQLFVMLKIISRVKGFIPAITFSPRYVIFKNVLKLSKKKKLFTWLCLKFIKKKKLKIILVKL